jgi:hypothetical protein
MASQAALRASEWDVADVHWEHGATREQRSAQCVFRKGPPHHAWEPWVVVAESCILHRVGRRGLGLYWAGRRRLQQGDFVGLYEGAVVGTYPTRQAALDSPQCARLVRKGHDKLITRRPRDGGRGVELVDGDQGGGLPLLHYINDPRGTRLHPNVALTPGGYIQAVQARVPAFDLERDLEGNAASELRFSYGDEDYWDLMERLGTSAHYALDVG